VNDSATLSAIPDLDPDDILSSSHRLARRVLVFRQTESTNQLLLGLASSGAPEGTVVIANEQSAGRGQFGRAWHSAPNLGLWMSVLARPRRLLRDWQPLSELAARAVIAAVHEQTGLECQIKAPNDVLLHGRKICGILIATRSGPDAFAVIGIGLNVHHQTGDFPENLQATAASVSQFAVAPRRSDLARAILAFLSERLEVFDREIVG